MSDNELINKIEKLLVKGFCIGRYSIDQHDNEDYFGVADTGKEFTAATLEELINKALEELDGENTEEI